MEKPVMIVALDDSEHSYYTLDWTLQHFFSPSPGNSPFKLVIVHAKPSPATSIGLMAPIGPGLPMAVGPNVMTYVDIDLDLKRIAAKVMEKAKEVCTSKLVEDVILEVVEGDARNVLSEAVDKYHASVLVVGSHGYGAIKRAFLGSVSDYCAHHAHCSVMIVKKPKIKN